MGVEVAGSDVAHVNGEVKDLVHEGENVSDNASSEPIIFGSHGVDEQQSKGEAKDVSNAKDAVVEWPAEPQVHSFWVVKYRSYDDPKLKAEIEKLEKDIQKINSQITQTFEELNAQKPGKEELSAKLASLGQEGSQYKELINQKRNQLKPLKDALGDLRGPGREKGVNICSTEEELNRLIKSMEYRIQHESVTLKEEKQILRDIRELEVTRPKVVANAAMRAKVQESMGQKEAIEDQAKLLGSDLDGVKKQREAVQQKREQLHAQLVVIRTKMNSLFTEGEHLRQKKKSLVESVQELRKKRDDGNQVFYENRTILSNVRELAAKKNVKALEELVNTEVEKFMSKWNSSKAFRSDYEKRILLSLDMRQLSRDARMRNYDEKPIVTVESPALSESKAAPKSTNKPQKEDQNTNLKAEALPAEKVQNEPKKASKESKVISERSMEEEDFFVVEKPKKDASKGNAIDAAKLKELKKEEEKEKQKQALERKKKLQEKAAAKAALRAQKEAEKKQKEREKKLKKKEVPSDEPTNEEVPSDNAEVDELEKSDNAEDAVEAVAPAKAKESALRHRKPTKARGTVPKALLKKKKAANYWLFASAGAAAVVVLLLLYLGFAYYQKAQVAAN